MLILGIEEKPIRISSSAWKTPVRARAEIGGIRFLRHVGNTGRGFHSMKRVNGD